MRHQQHCCQKNEAAITLIARSFAKQLRRVLPAAGVKTAAELYWCPPSKHMPNSSNAPPTVSTLSAPVKQDWQVVHTVTHQIACRDTASTASTQLALQRCETSSHRPTSNQQMKLMSVSIWVSSMYTGSLIAQAACRSIGWGCRAR